MTAHNAKSECQLEVLSTEFDAYNRAITYAHVSGQLGHGVRAESRLYDHCVNAGMSHDEPDHIEWAALKIGSWFSSGHG